MTALLVAGAAVGGANTFLAGFRRSLGVSGKAALVVSQRMHAAACQPKPLQANLRRICRCHQLSVCSGCSLSLHFTSAPSKNSIKPLKSQEISSSQCRCSLMPAGCSCQAYGRQEMQNFWPAPAVGCYNTTCVQTACDKLALMITQSTTCLLWRVQQFPLKLSLDCMHTYHHKCFTGQTIFVFTHTNSALLNCWS